MRLNPWIVTPCHRGRLDELEAMLTSIDADPRFTVIVTTLPDPIDPLKVDAMHVLLFDQPGMLFGQWVNRGLDYIASIEGEKSEVLVIGSSLRGTPATIPSLQTALRGHNLTMCGPDLFGRLGGGQVEEHRTDPRTLWNRVPGICFMVPGELGLRFDPDFRWWYGEDDLEMQARQHGNVGVVGGCEITLTAPNGHPLNAEQAQHATEDRAKFVAKWGHEPW